MTSSLFPVHDFILGFTTTSISLPNLVHVALDDKELGIHKRNSRTSYPLVVPPLTPPDPSLPTPELAWEAFYPKGSINPTAPIPGGFGFYLSGPPSFAEGITRANEVIFSYRMMLEPGWDWARGGKLPGICERAQFRHNNTNNPTYL